MAHDSRYHQEWPVLSRYIRTLFNHHCARCGRDSRRPGNSREQLQVHHIDGNPGNNDLENLIPLCAECHLQIEKEARIHAPHSDIQQELFADSTYFVRMQEMRRDALARFGNGLETGVSQMSDEEYEDYINRKEWEEDP